MCFTCNSSFNPPVTYQLLSLCQRYDLLPPAVVKIAFVKYMRLVFLLALKFYNAVHGRTISST